jgi:hypothetical protein
MYSVMAETHNTATFDLNTLNDQSMVGVYTGETQPSPELSQKKWAWNGKQFSVIRYKKDMVNNSNICGLGKFRSVITCDGKVVCVAPPKSVPEHALSDERRYEEFIDGTMVNAFKICDDWELATRSSVGAKVGFFRKGESGKTFRTMFLDAVSVAETKTGMDFFNTMNTLDDNVCLSFVVQHPDNRIVTPISEVAIYLVAAYKIEKNVVSLVDRDSVATRFGDMVKTPAVISIDNFHNYKTGMESDYKKVGIMVYDALGQRSKIRNPAYERVRQLRGNQPKLQYRYLVLRKERLVGEYLKFYPEDSKQFTKYREMVHDYTNALYNNYRECYIRKAKPLREYPDEYRTNMFKLHEHYIQTLRPNNMYITKGEVIRYVNTMQSAILMHAINLPYHRYKEESQTQETMVDTGNEQVENTETES